MMPPDHGQVGWVGLGSMGFGMATHLVKKGYNVKGFDVFAKSVERFAATGGVAASSLEDSAVGCQSYVCMVATAQQAQGALFDNEDSIVRSLPHGATLLLCSTVPSTYAKHAEAQLLKIGRSDIYFVDCPVSGGATRAADGTLSIMAGASKAALEKAKSLLQAMSAPKKLFLVPGGIGQGSNMKMVHQVLAGIQILAASEAMGFASRLGLDARATMDAVNSSKSWSWMFENRVPRMLSEDYMPPVSALTIILKDVGIITSMGRVTGFPLPLSSTAEQVYLQGLSAGFGSDDDAGMVRIYHSEPLSRSQDPSAVIDSETKRAYVLTLLRCIHVAATAEAISYAHSLGIDLAQFHDLACEAAGATTMFRDLALPMIERIEKADKETVDKHSAATKQALWKATQDLSSVLEKAQELRCPLYLGSAILAMFQRAATHGQHNLDKATSLLHVIGSIS